MANLNPRNLSLLRSQNPALGECLQDIVASHNSVAQQLNASPVGIADPPPPHSDLKVTGGEGYFSARITAAAPAFRGQEHFLEVSEDKNFGPGTVHMEHLGASTSLYRNYGEKTLHFRSYSAYAASGPSAFTYAMNVSGKGGTAPSLRGNASGQGYGSTPFLNSATVPKR